MGTKTMSTQNTKSVDELSEDMDVVGPGQMLSDARKILSLSTGDIAEKLKFKISLVENIEQDIFDQKLPATYNRGYLRSYAKLVNIDADELLTAYDMLGVANVQRSEMQSFSNLTGKQAEHSRLMWFSYFIVALLLGLMVLWWVQESKQLADDTTGQEPQAVVSESSDEKSIIKQVTSENVIAKSAIDELNKDQVSNNTSEKTSIEQNVTKSNIFESKDVTIKKVTSELSQEITPALSTAVVTFSGDCWVNIYDATGERIAWGVKKSGYVMTVTGNAPLKVTLGKPELATIVFNGQSIDMSAFNAGNIAKFTLPLSL